jgi:hypothetical protein
MIRPVGNGVIGGAALCPPPGKLPGLANRPYRTLRDGLLDGTFQAFHAWLPSVSPSGTRTLCQIPYHNSLLDYHESRFRG